MSEPTQPQDPSGVDAAVAEALKRAAAAGVLPSGDGKGAKPRAGKAAPPAEQPPAPPAPVVRPPARLRVLERFTVNMGSYGGIQIYHRGDVLREEDFIPRIWGDILEGLNRKVVVL